MPGILFFSEKWNSKTHRNSFSEICQNLCYMEGRAHFEKSEKKLVVGKTDHNDLSLLNASREYFKISEISQKDVFFSIFAFDFPV